MDYKEFLVRLGYVRNKANLSARELSLRMGKSAQYIGMVERGRFQLSIGNLFQVLEICNFSVARFFSDDFYDYDENREIERLLENLSSDKKKSLIDFLKK